MGSGEVIIELGHSSSGAKLEVPLLEANVKIKGFHSLGTNWRWGGYDGQNARLVTFQLDDQSLKLTQIQDISSFMIFPFLRLKFKHISEKCL